MSDEQPVPRPTVASIILRASQVFKVPPATFRSPNRLRKNTLARFAVYTLAREMTKLSYPLIGARMGGRDHSSVINGVRQAAVYAARDPKYAAQIQEVRELVLEDVAAGLIWGPEKITVKPPPPPPPPPPPKPPFVPRSKRDIAPDDYELDNLDLISARVARAYGRD